MAGLMDAKRAHDRAARVGFSRLAAAEQQREAVNADLEARERAGMLSSVGQGAAIGAYAGGPVGAVVGAVAGGLMQSLF